MRILLRCVAIFALVGALLPFISAQDAKQDPKKVDDPSKKTDDTAKKKAVPYTVDQILKANILKGKVKEIKEEGKEIFFYTMDPEKLQTFQQWDAQAKQGIAAANTPQEQADRIKAYKTELPKQRDEIFAGEIKSSLLSESVHVRTSYPPPTYDAAGNLKQPTQAMLAKLRPPGTRLPGYGAAFAGLKVGQIVDIYTPKLMPTPKTIPGKKDFIGVDPALGKEVIPRVQAYMVYVAFDAE